VAYYGDGRDRIDFKLVIYCSFGHCLFTPNVMQSDLNSLWFA